MAPGKPRTRFARNPNALVMKPAEASAPEGDNSDGRAVVNLVEKDPERSLVVPRGSLAAHVRSLRQQRRAERLEPGKGCSSGSLKRRLHKNAPMEVDTTQRRSLTRTREVVLKRATKPLDPRFDPLCGRFDENVFRQRYSFLRALRERALAESKTKLATLESSLKRAPAAERESLLALRQKLRSEVDRRENQVRREDSSERARAILQSHKRHETEQIAAGVKQRPYFMKRSVVREHLKAQTMHELKKQRRWKRYLERKERAATAKARKLLREPSQPTSVNRSDRLDHNAS
ncbi:hypothetical protein CCYA_CCYA10G2901 [Cyanidiococcus yangmingshanensis]|nr:hypothetical protein CCYA_CCYA10G2901 [Cyanidiococcus yangmingshanensis]